MKRNFIVALFAVQLCLPLFNALSAQLVLTSEPVLLPADGRSESKVVVGLISGSRERAGRIIRLATDRKVVDRIVPEEARTDETGVAQFLLSSTKPGISHLHVTMDGRKVPMMVQFNFNEFPDGEFGEPFEQMRGGWKVRSGELTPQVKERDSALVLLPGRFDNGTITFKAKGVCELHSWVSSKTCPGL